MALYGYDPGHGAGVLKRLLDSSKGYLQTGSYNVAVTVNDFEHVGCMMHARRKFNGTVKAQDKKKQRGKAHRGPALTQKLYRIEKQAQRLKPETRHDRRQRHAQPILDQLHTWLLGCSATPNATSRALNYLHNECDELTRYLDDGLLASDRQQL